MHLSQVLAQRSTAGTGVYYAMTRRCPLSCRHCLTNSTMSIPDNDVAHFLRLTDTFDGAEAPSLVLMSGGEPLLKAPAVADVAGRAAGHGVASYLLSGMFFARRGRVPTAISEAIASVDHFAASLDVFHEEEVPRTAVLEFLAALAADGRQVSLQVVGRDDDDPYLADVVADVERVLGRAVPVLVGHVAPVGRAAEWMSVPSPAVPDGGAGGAGGAGPGAVPASPCELATWPVVRHDGRVVACVNEEAVEAEPTPPHLFVGDATHEPWSVIVRRLRNREVLRAIRTVGPERLAPGACAAGQCRTCLSLPASLSSAPDLAEHVVSPALERATAALLGAGGPVGYVRRHGSVRYAELVQWGLPAEVPA